MATKGKKVSLQTVERLSVYRKVLDELHSAGVTNLYSHELARYAGVSPAQLRRDLSTFGSFGNISKGYNVFQLILTISRVLGTDQLQTVALVGVGNLGRTLLAYPGFEERGFHIGVAFDADREKVGRVFAGRRCHGMDELESVLAEYEATLAILATRPAGLQKLVSRLAEAGVRSVLNFVPRHVMPPDGVHIETMDIAARLEKLSFLGRQQG